MAGLGLPGREKVVSGLPREGKRQFWGSWEGKRAVSGLPREEKGGFGAPQGEGRFQGCPGREKGGFGGSPGREKVVSGLLGRENGSFEASGEGKWQFQGSPQADEEVGGCPSPSPQSFLSPCLH